METMLDTDTVRKIVVEEMLKAFQQPTRDEIKRQVMEALKITRGPYPVVRL
jgi:hypothetical protein